MNTFGPYAHAVTRTMGGVQCFLFPLLSKCSHWAWNCRKLKLVLEYSGKLNSLVRNFALMFWSFLRSHTSLNLSPLKACYPGYPQSARTLPHSINRYPEIIHRSCQCTLVPAAKVLVLTPGILSHTHTLTLQSFDALGQDLSFCWASTFRP